MLRELDALGYEGDYALEFELGGDPEAMAELALKPGTPHACRAGCWLVLGATVVPSVRVHEWSDPPHVSGAGEGLAHWRSVFGQLAARL